MDQRHRYPVELLTSSRAMSVSMFSEVSVLQEAATCQQTLQHRLRRR